MPTPDIGKSESKYRWFAALAFLGVAIRAVFLFLARDASPFYDESQYVYLGICWNHFGFYSGNGMFLWPPGYPFFLSVFLRLFQADGVLASKICQVALSGVIGFVTMLIADRVFSRRTALVAGGIWCVYLPLIGFTHTNWPETVFLAIFLPSIYLLLTWWIDSERGEAHGGRLLLAGLLFGLALLVKEAILYLGVLLALLIIWRHRRISWVAGCSHAVLFGLSIAAVIVPWALRNYEVYGRFAPVGATLGENCYQGILRAHSSFDYPDWAMPEEDRERLYGRGQTGWRYRWFVERPDDFELERVEPPNVVDKSGANVEKALEVAKRHPGWFIRGRIKKLAAWAMPMSFFVRHFGMEAYTGPLADPGARRPLLVFCIFITALVIVFSIPGLILSLRSPGARVMLGGTLAYFVATALLAGMSRHRASVEPLMIIMAAAILTGCGRPFLRRPFAVVGVIVTWCGLAFLWFITYAEFATFLRLAWGG